MKPQASSCVLLSFLLLAISFHFSDAIQEIPIGGIFEAGSIGENAFSFAVYAYNKNPHNPFRLLSKKSILTPPYDSVSAMNRFCDLNSDPLLAVFTSELAFNSEVNRILADTASAIQVPLITIANGESGIFTRNLMPSTVEALAEVLVYENWTSFSYLATSLDGIERSKELVEELQIQWGNHSLEEVTIHYIRVQGVNESSLQESLNSLEGSLNKRTNRRIIVDAKITEAGTLMKMLSRMGMNRREYTFLFAGLNVADTDLVDYIYSGVNLAGFRLMDPERPEVKQFLADWSSWNSQGGSTPPFYHAALMADAITLFTSTLSCRLQQMDVQRANISLGELASVANQIRQSSSGDGKASGYSLFTKSSCYLSGRLMYQHGAYQVRGKGTIAELRRKFVSRNARDGCGDLSLRGLTGDLKAPAIKEEREVGDLVLWSAEENAGLQPVARWSTTKGLDYEAFKVETDQDFDGSGVDDFINEDGLPQIWEEDFDPHVIIDRSRLADYKNRTIRVVTIISKPFVTRKPRKLGSLEPRSVDQFEGFCVDLLEKIAEKVGFKYEIHTVYDGNFGVKLKSGPKEKVIVLSRRPFSNQIERRYEYRQLQDWSGLIGEILTNKADLVMAPVTISYSRAQVVEFSEPFLAFGLSIIIKKPGKQKSGSLSFLRPLSNSVWLAIFGAWLAVSIGLYIIARISPTEWQFKTDPITRKRYFNRRFSFGNSVWISFAAFVQQGVDFAPRAPGTRLLVATWWFVTLILIAFYTANLAAFLTISLRVPPINGWTDLLKSDMDYGWLKSGSTRDFFNKTKLEPFAQLAKHIEQHQDSLVGTVDEGVDRVRKSKGKYAFILESVMNEYHNNREPCDTMMVNGAFGNYGYGIALPRRSPMREALSDAVLQLREEQVIATLRKKWWIERGQCNAASDSDRSAADNLALINVAGVFHILTGGLLLALLVAALELTWHLSLRRNASKKHKTTSLSPSNVLKANQPVDARDADPWTMQ